MENDREVIGRRAIKIESVKFIMDNYELFIYHRRTQAKTDQLLYDLYNN
jgi:hypothetical protein